MMLEEELDELLDGMLEYTSGTGLEKWTRKLASRKHKRCFVHTSKKHICAKQGGTSRCEQAYSIYKGSGTLNAEITKWSIVELLEKIESDMDHYRETCLEEFQKIILGQKGFISKYVRDIEKEETNRMLELNLEITDKEENVDDPFHKPVVSDEGGNDDHVEDQVAAPKGTKYTMVRGDRKYKTVTVFIPDDTTLHAKSDFYSHTSFWIRCRYIQRALLDHPTRGMNDMSTLHTRWDLRRHPLYKVKYDSLVSSMQIMVGDHPVEYLPPALHPNADNADRCPLPTGTVAPPTTDVSAVVIPVPRADTGVERFKKICETSRKIEKMAKANAQVYEMAVVSLKALYDSCLTMTGSSDVAKKAAAKAIANDRNIPLVPQELLDNEGATVNMSNHSAASTRKKKPKPKAKTTNRKNVGDSATTASSDSGSNVRQMGTSGSSNRASISYADAASSRGGSGSATLMDVEGNGSRMMMGNEGLNMTMHRMMTNPNNTAMAGGGGGGGGSAIRGGNMMCVANNTMIASTNNDIGGVGGTTAGAGAANHNLMASTIGGNQAQNHLSAGAVGVGNARTNIVARRNVGTLNADSDRVDYVPGGGHLGEYLGDCLPRDPCEMCEKLSVQLGRQLNANHAHASCPNKQLYKATFGSNGFGNEFGM